ncbi:SF0329 family protein [Niallia sp. 03190]|uniref:SF0329 family protein n=1 Tax=Niallia sp. 03190 TaxID=3458061 RepID=UPI0040443408
MLFSPKWSKAKKHLSNFICEPLRKRVDFQVINYRKAHDQLGRAVITVDKVEVLSMCTITAEIEEYYREREIRAKTNQYNCDYNDVTKNRAIQDQAHKMLKAEGIYGQYDFFSALEEYFNSPIEELLKSSEISIKILCLIDRRIGKRTLRKFEMEDEHELVQYFYKLRCEVENLKVVT